MRHHLDRQPGAVGCEAADGMWFYLRSVWRHLGVAAMIGLQFQRLPIAVGDEGVIAKRASWEPGVGFTRRTMSRTGAASGSGTGCKLSRNIGGAVHPVGNGSLLLRLAGPAGWRAGGW